MVGAGCTGVCLEVDDGDPCNPEHRPADTDPIAVCSASMESGGRRAWSSARGRHQTGDVVRVTITTRKSPRLVERSNLLISPRPVDGPA
jgi:hypothetical protein